MRSTQSKIFIWIAAIFLFIGSIYALLCYLDREQETTLSYKECKIPFKYSGTLDTISLEYISAKNELARCVCESYIKTRDTVTSKKIMELYKEFGSPVKPDSSKYDAYKRLDSIVKYRKSVFDTMILLD